jgi:hypothetical protein
MKKLLLFVVLCLIVAVPCSSYGRGGGPGGGHSSGPSGHSAVGSHGFSIPHPEGGARWYGGYSRGSHHYGGQYYGGYSRYYYRGYAPRGALFGAFLGGIVIGGTYSPFWWPYYAVSVPPIYYDPYYQYPYPAPPYVIVVPPAETTTADSQGPSPATIPPNQCYAPKTDSNGNVIKDKNSNMTPDFSKPVPCPPQQ